MLGSSKFMRSPTRLILSLGLAGLLVACQSVSPPSSTPPSAPVVNNSDPSTSPISANRIVALTSLSADIIQRLNGSKLVGISGSRLLAQKSEFSKLPRVSEGQTPPNLEKILALKPDLVIGADGFHDQVLKKLQESGIRTLKTQVNDWRSLETLTRTLAKETQADPAPLLTSYETFLGNNPVNPNSTLVLVSYQPILAPNKTSWAGDLLQKFQVNNLAANLQGESLQRGYVSLSPEKVLEANPDVLILVDVGDGTVEKLKASPFWNKLKAVAENRVYVFDYYGLVNPGSIEAIETACLKLKAVLANQAS